MVHNFKYQIIHEQKEASSVYESDPYYSFNKNKCGRHDKYSSLSYMPAIEVNSDLRILFFLLNKILAGQ